MSVRLPVIGIVLSSPLEIGKEAHRRGVPWMSSLQKVSLSHAGDPVISLELISSTLNKMLGEYFDLIFKVREKRSSL